MSGAATTAAEVGAFAAELRYEDLPHDVAERARHLVLDSVGIAFASTAFDFSKRAADALNGFGAGDCPVIGMRHRLPVRDAATLNGVLIHGLDFDDTHTAGIVHVTAGAFPAALGAGWHHERSCRDVLVAYVLAVEIAARIGIGARGGFHDAGFHPTGVAGAFGAAVAAGKLAGLDAPGIASAQGVVGSMAAGLMEFLEDGSWTKRQHPGWAAACGLNAAALAGAGWVGPPAVYEGRFGLYATHLPGVVTDAQAVSRDLGSVWELTATAVKPYPACHFTHAFIDLTLALLGESGASASDIESIRCLIHPIPGKVVCEPAENKRRPTSDYDAKFSLAYLVAAAATRGRLTLTELEDDALADPAILALCDRVEVADDPDSAFPDAYSGFVEITLTDGRRLARREQINRGHADRPLTNEEIVEKFRGTIGTVTDKRTADRVYEAVMTLGADVPARQLAERCRLEE
ncbi:MAG: MmgE/PrpD family protein [Streptosporangiales bacterium]|nr:MmgE/PrpD family protein [Streptosporangiales bacterium]